MTHTVLLGLILFASPLAAQGDAWEYARLLLIGGRPTLWSAGDSSIVVDPQFTHEPENPPRNDKNNPLVTRGAPLLVRILNRFGVDGWELVAVTRDQTDEQYLFKRRRRSDAR